MKDKDSGAGQQKKRDLGLPFVGGLLLLAAVLGWFMFRNYTTSSQLISQSLFNTQKLGPTLTIDGCAQHTMSWYTNCDAMSQLCDNSVSQVMKVCLVNGEKFAQCESYGDDIQQYDFTENHCRSYMANKDLKKFENACADVWQTVVDYCRSAKEAGQIQKRAIQDPKAQ